MEDDPRAKEVTEFLHKKKELDEQPPDYRCLIALMLGIMSYQLEVRLALILVQWYLTTYVGTITSVSRTHLFGFVFIKLRV